MKLLLFLGAGASVELGIPAMRAMAHELHGHMVNQRLSSTVLERFEKMLSDADYDIEHLIEIIDGIVDGAKQRTKLQLSVEDELDKVAPVMRQEAEWYVQHACERLREVEARVLWRAALARTGEHTIWFATTNYDRSLEIGSRFNDISIDDGFEQFNGREVAPWRGVRHDRPLQLLKMHGSTDWYQGSDGRTFKLRHPMPLYGNLAVVDDGSEWPKMTSALVLPTREKRVTHPPYPELVTSFRNAAAAAECAIFVGTSLRDPDILDVCTRCASRIPTYFVSKDGAPTGSAANPKLKVVVQKAARFIASTLPEFLAKSASDSLGEMTASANVEDGSVLDWLVAIQDETRTPKEICSAIERLSDSSVAVDAAALRPLLEHEDHTVRRYAVALVDKSLDRAEVMELAEERARIEPEGLLAEELTMLKTLIGDREKPPRAT
ncbi:MAG: SIR2 family protein [Acidobacteria bacterium]|nr:SIR2 family protein [Acidobacteriota bacterium]